MAVHFHTLKVKEVRKETPDSVSIAFSLPADLKDIFAFTPGQNITIKKELGGEEVRRSYSICTAPYEDELRIAVKKVEGGKFSSFANESLQAGDALDVLPPTGKFHTPLHADHQKQYLAFAAGSGITPVISIIKSTLRDEPQSQFTLVFGNRGRNSIIFFEELEGLKNSNIDRFSFINILSRERTEAPINSGRIDLQKLEDLSRLIKYERMDELFLCGPGEMIFCVREFLLKRGTNSRKIHFELFTTPGQKQVVSHKPDLVSDAGPRSSITVKLDGRSFDFKLGFHSDSILDAALKQGADLPFACKGGVCCTCKARLVEGEVEMDVNWGLEQEEVEQGYILTCQSHPRTDRIVVDFDVK